MHETLPILEIELLREGMREEERLVAYESVGGRRNWLGGTKAAKWNLRLISVVLRWVAMTFRFERYAGKLESSSIKEAQPAAPNTEGSE